MPGSVVCSERLEGPAPNGVLWALLERPNPVVFDTPNGRTILSFGSAPLLEPRDSLEAEIRGALAARQSPGGHPFAGGVMGYVSYESGRFFERMPGARGPLPIPEFGLRRYEGSLVFEEDHWWVAGSERFLEEARALLRQATCQEQIKRRPL